MTREPIEVTRQDRIYCLKASSDYHRELCEECRFYPNCDHMTQDDMTELTIKDLEALEQEPTTKNDLEVDWESYKDVDGNSLDDLILEVLQNNFDCGNTYGYKVADEIIGLLPSVTPQEPALDKIREEIGKAWHTKPKNRYEEGLKDQALKDMQIINKYKAESEGKK